MDPYLIIAGDGCHRPLSSEKQCWTIGRDADNDIVIDSPGVSRHHAMFQHLAIGANAKAFYLVDRRSQNGSMVNGRRAVAPVKLVDGDRLMLGRVAVQFRCPASSDKSISAGDGEGGGAVELAETDPLRETRLISVLVVDIRSYTVLGRTIDRQLFSEVIADFHTRAGHALRLRGCWDEKSTGDGRMAIWTHDEAPAAQQGAGIIDGPDLAPKDDATVVLPQGAEPDPQVIRALRAVVAIADLIAALNEKFRLPLPLRCGAGVNTGHATVGSMGRGDLPEYSAYGEAVTAAFRFESATKQLGTDVVIGQGTYDRLFLEFGSATLSTKRPFTLHSVELKGYDSLQAVYGCSFSDLRDFLQALEGGRMTE